MHRFCFSFLCLAIGLSPLSTSAADRRPDLKLGDTTGLRFTVSGKAPKGTIGNLVDDSDKETGEKVVVRGLFVNPSERDVVEVRATRILNIFVRLGRNTDKLPVYQLVGTDPEDFRLDPAKLKKKPGPNREAKDSPSNDPPKGRPGPKAAEPRIWTSTEGSTLEATFIRVLDNHQVQLRLKDGRILLLPLGKLSVEDHN